MTQKNLLLQHCGNKESYTAHQSSRGRLIAEWGRERTAEEASGTRAAEERRRHGRGHAFNRGILHMFMWPDDILCQDP